MSKMMPALALVLGAAACVALLGWPDPGNTAGLTLARRDGGTSVWRMTEGGRTHWIVVRGGKATAHEPVFGNLERRQADDFLRRLDLDR